MVRALRGVPSPGRTTTACCLVISVLRGVRQVDLVGQVDIAVIRIGRRRRPRVVLIGELKIELLAERGSLTRP